jgi:hypothetical protein
MFERIIIITSLLLVPAIGVSEGLPEPRGKPVETAKLADAQAQSSVEKLAGDPAPQSDKHMVRFQGLEAPVAEHWLREEPANRLRLAQFSIPVTDETEKGELVIYYFGRSRGSVDANIARWKSQFSGPEGAPVEPKIDVIEIEGMAVTLVELHGDYARNLGTGPSRTVKPDQTMVVAILEAADGMVFVQLHGPTAMVNENRKAFDTLINGIRQTGTTESISRAANQGH